MRKLFLALMMIALLVTGCNGQHNSTGNDKIRAGNTIIVGIDDEYAPFGFRNDQNEIVGFDVDLAKEVGKRMGIEFEFKPINWNNKENDLKSGNIDIIWNGFDITPERKKNILYSKPYMDNRQILLSKLGTGFNVYSEYDLAGRIIGTQAGSNSEDYVNRNKKLKNSLADFKTYTTFKQAFEDLENGNVDVLIVDELAARYEMSKYPPKFELIEVTVGPVTEIGIGFRKDDTELRDQVQKAFDEVVKDGTAKKISEKWFRADLIKSRR